MRGVTLSRLALAIAAVLVALSFVAARQGQGMRVLAEVEALRAQIDVERSREDEYIGQVRRLESRGIIVPRAEAELGMHGPVGDELRFYAAGRP
jgi:cell division protein FtsL